MADSGALRARRLRWHRNGDHSLCKPGNCDVAGPASAAERKITPTKVAAVDRPSKASASPARRRAAGRDGIPGEAPPPPAPPAEEPPAQPAEPGGIEKATTAFLESLPFSDDDNDPRTLQGQICIMLARRIDTSGAMPAVVRELRTMLNQISEVPSQAAGPVDDARYHRAMRRFETYLSRL